MKVSEVMSHQVTIARPDDTLQGGEGNADRPPVPCPSARMTGMITGRDIAVRAVAEGLDPATTTVKEIMSDEVKYCFDDEPVDHVADNNG